MDDKEVFTGLDIGTTKVRVAVGKPNFNGKLTLLSMVEVPSEGVVRSTITNIDKTVSAIKEAISKASKEANVEITSANVSLAGRHTKSLVHHSGITRDAVEGEITEEDVMRLNQDMYRIATPIGHEVVDIIPKEYAVDGEEGIKDPIGMAGVRLRGDFHVITAQSNVINNTYKCAKKAGLSIDNLILSPLPSSLAVLTDEEKEAGVCLVDIGAGTVGFTIYHGGSLQHLKLIPFAGEAITSDLAQAFVLTASQAEDLKITFGSAYEKEQKNEIVAIPSLRNRPEKEIFSPVINRVIEQRMEEIIQLVYKEIVSAGFEDKLPAGIVITGGGALLREVDKLFTFITGYDTRLGYPCSLLKDQDMGALNIDYSTAAGLVLAGYKSLGFPEKYYGKKHKLVEVVVKKKEKSPKKSSGFFGFLRDVFS